MDQESKIKQMQKIVCICKGIPLKRVLPALKESETVEEVHKKSGTGQGGCNATRCGPRIELLLEKMDRLKKEKKKKES